MTYRVGPKGQVVLPKALRDAVGIRPGDDVEVERRDDALVVRRAPVSAASLLGLLKDPSAPGSLTRELEAEHRREIARDDVGGGR